MKDASTILVVDDDRVGRQLLTALLEPEGYRLITATSGADALAMASNHAPDVVLLDVMLPDIDGYEVCRLIRADDDLAETPVIMITALNDRASRLQGIEVGADDFLTKPFDRVELLARVRVITRLARNRRLLLERLKAERDRTRAILEALGEAVVVTDVDGNIEYVNPSALQQTGYARDEMIGQNFLTLSGADRRLQAFFDQGDRHGSFAPWHGELVTPRRDGTCFNAALTLAPLRSLDEPAGAVGFVGVLRDITPLKQAEWMKERFISNISHELRTPLSIITLLSGNLDTLYDRLDDGKRRHMIRDIRKHAQVLDDLIGDVLEIARIDSGHIFSEPIRLNLVDLIREEVERQRALSDRMRLQVELHGPDRLAIEGDEDQLRRVLRNLINNAIKYNRQGGTLRLDWGSRDPQMDHAAWPGAAELPDGTWAAVRIGDTGVGLSEKDLPRIFDRFYRVKTKGNVSGTGLGLAIARELITWHAGHIAVASDLGHGTTIAFYLPMISGDPAA